KANGYPADGYPTPALLASIRKSAGGPPVADGALDMRPLKKAEIRDLQKTLAGLGYKLGKPTGTVTPGTRTAIKAEEKRAGVEQTGKATAYILAQAKQRLKEKKG